MFENKTKFNDISSKQYLIRLVTVCLFCAFALTLYFLGIINFACVLLIVFGGLWNFFVPINTFVSFVFCLLVCSLYALFSIKEGLYSNAILYFIVYVFLQYVVWVLYGDDDMAIKDKQMTMNTSYLVTCVIVVSLAVCFAISIVQGNQILPLMDAVTACMLGLSAFLQSFKYREYYVIRPIALIFAILLWIFAGYINGYGGANITAIIMYIMYLVLDLMTILSRVYNIAFSGDKKKKTISAEDEEKIDDKKAAFKKMVKQQEKEDEIKEKIKA